MRGLLRDARLSVDQACIEDIHYKVPVGWSAHKTAAPTDDAWIESQQNLVVIGPRQGEGKT